MTEHDHASAPITFAIITCSDTRGMKQDTAGAALEQLIADNGWVCKSHVVVKDEVPQISAAIVEACDTIDADVVLTCGGSGLSLRDVTPEATQAVCDRNVPGIAEAMRAHSLAITPFAMLSALHERTGVPIPAPLAALDGKQIRFTDSCDQDVASMEAAMERLLHSPLLGGADKLGEADAVIFTLLGGPELSLGETKQLLELAGRQVKPETRLIVGAATGEEWAGKLMLSAVTVRFDAESEASELLRSSSERAPKRTRSAAAHAADADQLILPLEPISKGVMERGPQVKWGNDDLDVPTFKRRNITIDNGKRGVEQ